MLNVLGQALIGAVAGQAGGIVGKVVDGLFEEAETSSYTSKITQEVIAILDNVSGIGQAHSRDLQRATPIFSLKDGTIVKFYQNLAFNHIFLADSEGKLIYAGVVGRMQANTLKEAIDKIRKEYT